MANIVYNKEGKPIAYGDNYNSPIIDCGDGTLRVPKDNGGCMYVNKSEVGRISGEVVDLPRKK